MNPRYFKTSAGFRRWLSENHAAVTELWVGFYKKGSGKGGITYHEAVRQALCFGWIDGVRKSVDENSYVNRFTPRKARSTWSLINIKHVEELKKLGLMEPAGLKAFAARDPNKSGVYSFERAALKLTPAYEKRFRQNERAWEFFSVQPPYYKKVAVFWIMSAKKEETKLRRLEALIQSSAAAERLTDVTGSAKKPSQN